MSFQFSTKSIEFLISPKGHDLLDRLMQEYDGKNTLKIIEKYRDEFTTEELSSAIELVLLREKAKSKFSKAEKMFFDRDGLEQASNEIVAENKARRFAKMGTVLELGCGIGGDTIALAKYTKVIAYEKDSARALMCRKNCEIYGLNNVEVMNTDFQKEPLPKCDAIYIDPARRFDGKRMFDPEDYTPPLSYVNELKKHCENICVKVSPGVDYEMSRETLGVFEVEIVSLNGECKEALLWFGQLRRKSIRSAAILPENIILNSSIKEIDIKVTAIKEYLYEPDSAIIRAHLIAEVAQELKCTLIDTDIAYLTSDEKILSPLVKTYKVEAVFPADMKKLKSELKSRNITAITIKKRGFSQSPQIVLKKLGMKEGDQAIVFLTFAQGKHVAILAQKTS